MREILFRGKRIDNKEWVEGLPFGSIYGGFSDGAIESIRKTAERYGDIHTVVIETVGQYTGLKDTNGKKIFEGDIVKLTDKSFGNKWKAVVEFGNPNGNYTWGWQLKPIGKAKNVNTDILCWVEMEETGAFCEIIGNKWDNPELLEVKK